MKIDKLKVNWTLIVTYILTFALIGSYVYILLHGISPHDACLEYQKYYVENVLEDWPGYGGLDYEIGDVKYFATDHEKMRSILEVQDGDNLKVKAAGQLGKRRIFMRIL